MSSMGKISGEIEGSHGLAAAKSINPTYQSRNPCDPLWYKDAIIYELHVKAFYDSCGDGIGDFPGLIEKLDYLSELGITAVWLLPHYPSPLKDDGYDIADYLDVNRSYGTLRDFRRFVREAHKRDIRVITELVINHTSDQHPWFQAARRAPPGSPKRDFYVFSNSDQKYKNARIIFTDSETSNWSWDPVAKAYYWHRFFSHQPDLNFDNPRVIKAVIKTLCFWFDMGVDGMRLDAVPYLVERENTSCENLPETLDVLRKIRCELDARYEGKMLLAEANQWPEDVRPYFGDGDICHMAFHFPLMPRIFMAVRQEDRHPITEILRQTPPIPEQCQWALFLRNHDELTLEMVSDEERDYMYKEYAVDSQMRLNIGIRRRLAPLLNFSRRRIELLYSLLFSFPGSPVIYYGDEIGMGDNIYLGDRNGVRTPMQWNCDRNGGFSRADSAKLYSPVIVETNGGYQAINVEAQQHNPSSLLNWIKRMIALRKQHPTFSRGDIFFLTPKNRKILAYIRQYNDQMILCVANLSRFVQPVELDLSQYNGLTPIEMIGSVEFPTIGELPYFLTLSAHAFYWFNLSPSKRRDITSKPPIESGIKSGFSNLSMVIDIEQPTLSAEAIRILEDDLLEPFLQQQRWFAGKNREIEEIVISEWSALRSAAMPLFLLLVAVDYCDAGRELYFIPLTIALRSDVGEGEQQKNSSVVALLSNSSGNYILCDALQDNSSSIALLRAIGDRFELPNERGIGTFRAFPTAPFTADLSQSTTPLKIVLNSGEQSNSTLLFLPEYVLKLFRRLEPGINCDAEVGRYLSEKTTFESIPKTLGSLEYHGENGNNDLFTLALVQQYVPNQGDGWTHALGQVRRYFELAAIAVKTPEATSGNNPLFQMMIGDTISPTPLGEIIGSYQQTALTLANRTAEMHLALGQESSDSSFGREPLTARDLEEITREARERAKGVLALLSQSVDTLAEPIAELAHILLGHRSQLLKIFDLLAATPLKAMKIRCHGDYHLGQLLWCENDFIIIDFEGEPNLPLALRRKKFSPLKDVAGMLRSFDYAAYSELFSISYENAQEFDRLEPWANLWKDHISTLFLNEYRKKMATSELLPKDDEQFFRLMRFYLLDKAVYELQYELNSRPPWVRIPLHGILNLLIK